MSDHEPTWIRYRPDSKQNRLALGAGLAAGLVVGGVVFYLARLFVSREPIQPVPSRDVTAATRTGDRGAP